MLWLMEDVDAGSSSKSVRPLQQQSYSQRQANIDSGEAKSNLIKESDRDYLCELDSSQVLAYAALYLYNMDLLSNTTSCLIKIARG